MASLLLAPLAVQSKTSPSTVLRSNPTTVAKALYQDWQHGAAKAARKIADADAVDKLFGVRWRAMKFDGCQSREEGGFECIYRDAKDDFSMAMIVDGGVSVGGYNVASLSFSSEE